MNEKIRLLICEDNPGTLAELADFMGRQQHTEVIGTARDGMEALEMLRSLKPDAVITGLIMPQADGFTLLERMAEMEEPPKTIVLSSLSSESIVTRALELGAKYYMIKPFDRELLYKRVLDLFGMRELIRKNTAGGIRSRSLDEQITAIFLSIGIPAHIKGYQYLREAIKLVVHSPEMINQITKRLYPGIAEIFETSPSKVERAIRHAIEVAWTRGRIENINGIFGYNIYTKNDKPTNGEFIALIADRLLLRQTA
ncbi:MAG: sporulation transcription factor Spo0A [Christensenellaceae bacterium]|nr:sporulation transcription factor Spo0A [Christensenellaceae bacterium]